MYCNGFAGQMDYYGDYKSTAKNILQIPAKVVGTMISPLGKAAGDIVADVGAGAGSGISSITKPITPLLLIIGGIALAGGIGYLIYNKQKMQMFMKARE